MMDLVGICYLKQFFCEYDCMVGLVPNFFDSSLLFFRSADFEL